MDFDARKAKALAPGEHITVTDCPGLRLECSKVTGAKSWTYRYKSPVDGRMRQIKIGGWPAVPPFKAAAEWDALRNRRNAGEDVAASNKAARRDALAKLKGDSDVYTVKRLCDEYVEKHIRTTRRPDGQIQISQLFDRELAALYPLPAETLPRSAAFDLIQELSLRAPRQSAILRTELGAAWEYAMDSGRLPEATPNWWRRVLKGKIKSKGKKIRGEHVGTAKRTLSEDEVGRLILWLPNFSLLLRDALTTYLWTGVRGDEIVRIEGVEVAQESTGWWWTIPKEKTKNARFESATDLRVPLFGRALEVILRRKERYGDGYLYPPRSGKKAPHVTQRSISAGVYYHQPYSVTHHDKARPRLTVTHWSPHDLRRTARTLLASMKCPDAVGEAILGHMPPGIVGVYNQYKYDAERLEWLGKLSIHLESLAARQADLGLSLPAAG